MSRLTDDEQGSDGRFADEQRGSRPWFAPKRFGYGYRPASWQGFLVMAVILVVAVLIARVAHGGAAVALPAIIVVAGVIIRRTRSRPPRR